VKRAMNRPPSSRDPWWSDHQRTCGGVFEKVKEPEKKSRRTNSDKGKENISVPLHRYSIDISLIFIGLHRLMM